VKRLDFSEIKQAIDDYYKDHPGEVISYADLMDVFSFDLEDIIRACNELKSEDKIQIKNDLRG